MKHFILSISLLMCLSAVAQTRPVIGLSDTFKDGVSSVPRTYIEAVMAAGGIPVIVPLMNDDDKMSELLTSLDGVIFTGGGDFDPAYYNENPIPQNGKVNARRDVFDIRLLKLAVAQGVPVLGVCRGIQLINIAFGGSLYQDLPAQYPNKSVAHRQKQPLSSPSHSVIVQEGTELAKITGARMLEVNSAHHQAVKQLAPGFRISGKSTDGVIEAIERIDASHWVLGVQFHPEALYTRDPAMNSIITSLVNEAKINRTKRSAQLLAQTKQTPTEPTKNYIKQEETKENYKKQEETKENNIKQEETKENYKKQEETKENNNKQEETKENKPKEVVPTEFAAPIAKSDITFTKSELFDKLKGGWAGRFLSDNDINIDTVFVSVIERLGLDAPVDSFAAALAAADCNLRHANQAARYNLQHGIAPPASGHWHNNPHADDADFIAEADFIGLASPAMPNTTSALADRVGHIMSFGDGWYGGVFVAAMYSIAFTTDDILLIVEKALKTVPSQSRFYQCIRSVVNSYRRYPSEPQRALKESQQSRSDVTGCPDAVLQPFSSDASLSAVYVVMGLLYGNGDFQRTLEIANGAGQDSICSSAAACGILGVVQGYSNIPAEYRRLLEDSIPTQHPYSLNQVYETSFNHALLNIVRNGGTVDSEQVSIALQRPDTVRFEKSFEGLTPYKRKPLNKRLEDKLFSTKFKGSGIALRGNLSCTDNDYIAVLQVAIDGMIVETVQLPANARLRRNEIFLNCQLKYRKFKLTLKWLNPRNDAVITLNDVVTWRPEKK